MVRIRSGQLEFSWSAETIAAWHALTKIVDTAKPTELEIQRNLAKTLPSPASVLAGQFRSLMVFFNYIMVFSTLNHQYW